VNMDPVDVRVRGLIDHDEIKRAG